MTLYSDLSNNELQELPAAVFRTLRRVTVLHMSSNLIKELDENILRELREMEDVDFSRNKLVELPPLLFAGNLTLAPELNWKDAL